MLSHFSSSTRDWNRNQAVLDESATGLGGWAVGSVSTAGALHVGGEMVIFKYCIQAKLTLPRLITCAWDIQNAQDHFLTPSWTGDMPCGSLIFFSVPP